MPAISILPQQPIFTSFSTVSPATGRRSSVQRSQPQSPATPLASPPLTSLLDDDSDLINDYPDPVKRSDSLIGGGAQSFDDSYGTPLSPTSTLSSSFPQPVRQETNPFRKKSLSTTTTNTTTASNTSTSPPTADPRPAPSDDDIIMVTVKLSNRFRKSSLSGADDLPSRPPARSFLRRLSTHLNLDHSAEREERYRAVRMPRREHKRWFARDPRTGEYAGTEPEREWDEGELEEGFGRWKDCPLTPVGNGREINIGRNSAWGWQ